MSGAKDYRLAPTWRTVIADLGLNPADILRIAGLPEDLLSRSEILDALYGNSTAVTDRAIDAHIVRLRRKLGKGGSETSLIRTVHGVGYTIAASIVPVP